ncbi:MAG TPA: AraC family transcriptional regulator [Nannocystaceae bacterium]|nr:AraC family transcriptional regulator [Nannocystaceae bacterium]
MSSDPLSEVLRAIRLNGAFYFAIEATQPWVAEALPSKIVGPQLMPGVDHVIEYHVITAGSCWVGVLDAPPVLAVAGDVVAFPQGDAHVLSSAPGMRGGPSFDLVKHEERELPIKLSLHGGGAQGAAVICGFLGCDARPFNPLLAALPRMIHARAADGRTAAMRSLVELALAESTAARAGGACVLMRLSELLFVEVVRQYAEGLPPEQLGWLGGLRDPTVGRALQRMHARPTDDWTLEQLARESGASRTVLAERFAELVGVPPMQYLAQWRIQLAATMLRTTTATVAEIAERVGYGSEDSFARAFKRLTGLAPGAYRQS